MEWYEQFEHDFDIEDLLVFDDATLQHILRCDGFNLDLTDVARSMHGASPALLRHVIRNIPSGQIDVFMEALRRSALPEHVTRARQRMLDGLFWELTYWKTPALYDELTEGEHMHPGIFHHLAPHLRGKTVLDIGAGSGRASFECMRHGATVVYALDPAPAMRELLRHKVEQSPYRDSMIVGWGRFDRVPLATASVDMVVSCSAFTSESVQGGEPGLTELRRVTKPGGTIVIIWPRTRDRAWFVAHGFHYVTVAQDPAMTVRFRSIESALKCAKYFYASNNAVVAYILTHRSANIPFSVLGIDPPLDYCWLPVD